MNKNFGLALAVVGAAVAGYILIDGLDERGAGAGEVVGSPEIHTPVAPILPTIEDGDLGRVDQTSEIPKESVPEPEPAGSEAAEIGGLERALHPSRLIGIDYYKKQMNQSESPSSARLLAAQQLVIMSVALRMEIAGTALPTARAGELPIHSTAPLQFQHNGRQFRFETGEFPVWDEVVEARTRAEANPETLVPERLYESVAMLSAQVVQSVEEFQQSGD